MNRIGLPRFRGRFLGAFRHSYLERRAACDPEKDQADWALLQVPGGGDPRPRLRAWRLVSSGSVCAEAHGAGSGSGQALGLVLWEPWRPPTGGGGEERQEPDCSPGY